ncbi:hypothetical protein DPMN_165121 [Dreissena polymorpha]|uniref:Uncharacterized protein n=1 Tax=Dreissena polymorpha TaxID=45954 RepID=A0A9D4EVH5_DREPO|nr:hypothetical protein DPMN_165121 [Dreissena polymorpha]
MKDLVQKFGANLNLSETNEKTVDQQPKQVVLSTEVVNNNLEDEGQENEENMKKPNSECIDENGISKHSVALNSASPKHDDDKKQIDSEVKPPNPSGLAIGCNAFAGSHLDTFENKHVGTKTNNSYTPEKVGSDHTEELHDDYTVQSKQSHAENKKQDDQEEEMITQSGTVEIVSQPGQANNNNYFSSESQTSGGQNASVQTSKIEIQGNNQNIGTASRPTCNDQQARNKRLSNGKYRIEKQGARWCLREISSDTLYPQKKIVASSVEFEGTDLLVVDDVDYQIKISPKGIPILEKCYDDDTFESEAAQKATQGHMANQKEQQFANASQKHAKEDVQRESSFDQPITSDANFNTCGNQLQATGAQTDQGKYNR